MTEAAEMIDPVTGEIIDQKELAQALLEHAREQGVSLLGPGGLLAGRTKNVLETALEADVTERVGHERHETAENGNVRNGPRSKTVFTEVGPVEIDVSQGPRGQLRAADREEAPAPLGRDRRARFVADSPRPDDRRDRCVLR
jgi:putative transposase